MSKNPGSERKLAKKYAEALISASDSDNELEIISKDVQNLLLVFADKESALKKLSSAHVPQELFSEILGILQKELSLHDKTVNFLTLLQENNRTSILEKSLEIFTTLYRNKVGIISAEIVANSSLTEAQMGKIKDAISNKYKKEVIISFSEDDNLLGGFKLCLNGNLTIDCTMDSYLKNLKDELSSKIKHID